MGTELPRIAALAALERSATRILECQKGIDISRSDLREQLESIPEVEHELIEYFFDTVSGHSTGESQRINREEIHRFLDSEIENIRAADLNDDKILTTDETERLNKTGQLAVDLATRLQEQEPTPLALRHTLSGLEGKNLSTELRRIHQAHTRLSYSYARCVLFSDIFNIDGAVKEVYAGQTFEISGSPRKPEHDNVNTEHSWPKSRGIKGTAAVSDLHHLFPTDAAVNNKRSSYPFGEVVEVEWEKGGSKLGLDEQGNKVFEPPPEHRGQLARAMFYIHTMYEVPFQSDEEPVLREWHREHPVTEAERSRNDAISKYQKTRNPFVDYPELVDKIEKTAPGEGQSANFWYKLFSHIMLGRQD
ncbi:MAG: endonuclease [Myxococcota bacterium]|nr:endonuclease [Myxococcota bacterium]